MEIIKNIAATEAKTWEIIATAIDNNFSEQKQNINNKQPIGNYALKSELPDTSQLATKTELNTKLNISTYNSEKSNFATKTEIGNIETILDNIIGG